MNWFASNWFGSSWFGSSWFGTVGGSQYSSELGERRLAGYGESEYGTSADEDSEYRMWE